MRKSSNFYCGKWTYIIVWVVDHWWLPFALVGGILDHGMTPLTTTNRLTGWVSWRKREGAEIERGMEREGDEGWEGREHHTSRNCAH
jgi:hypothetical protein